LKDQSLNATKKKKARLDKTKKHHTKTIKTFPKWKGFFMPKILISHSKQIKQL